MIQTHFLTISGLKFDYKNPQSDQISIQDIIHALPNICRGNGHLKFHYSVAYHTILMIEVARKLKLSKHIQKIIMLHDASEIYANDLITFLKHFLPDYVSIENKIQTAIWQHFDLNVTEEDYKIVKKIDDMMKPFEAQYLFNHIEDACKSIDSVFNDIVIKELPISKVRKKYESLAIELGLYNRK